MMHGGGRRSSSAHAVSVLGKELHGVGLSFETVASVAGWSFLRCVTPPS